jgi:hypothetical protein
MIKKQMLKPEMKHDPNDCRFCAVCVFLRIISIVKYWQ